MSKKTISYRRLERILLGMGLLKKEVHGSHRLFSYPNSDIRIVLPIVPRMQVSNSQIAAVRRTIIENGIMTLEEFEKLLEGKK